MGWNVFHVRPKSEKKVAYVCKMQGIPHDLPLRVETKVYQRRKVVVHKPVFPGYVFANTNIENRVHVVRTNHIVQALVPENEDQLLFELEQLRLALAADPGLRAENTICKGARVRIKAGVFAGVEGVVDLSGKPGKVRLNVEMIGQSVCVDVDPDYLELIST